MADFVIENLLLLFRPYTGYCFSCPVGDRAYEIALFGGKIVWLIVVHEHDTDDGPMLHDRNVYQNGNADRVKQVR
ncbi:hypothetical protein D3C87_1983250 [compost metagenome]